MTLKLYLIHAIKISNVGTYKLYTVPTPPNETQHVRVKFDGKVGKLRVNMSTN